MESSDRTQDHERRMDEEELKQSLAEESPEGMPAGPEPTKSVWGMAVISLFVMVIIVGILIATLWHPIFGWSITAIGVALIVFNPVLWATFARAKDREKVEHEH